MKIKIDIDVRETYEKLRNFIIFHYLIIYLIIDHTEGQRINKPVILFKEILHRRLVTHWDMDSSRLRWAKTSENREKLYLLVTNQFKSSHLDVIYSIPDSFLFRIISSARFSVVKIVT